MSLADACIVRMAEIYDRHAVLTLDSDFLGLSQTWDHPARAHSPSAELGSPVMSFVDDTSPLANPLKVGLPVIHPH